VQLPVTVESTSFEQGCVNPVRAFIADARRIAVHLEDPELGQHTAMVAVDVGHNHSLSNSVSDRSALTGRRYFPAASVVHWSRDRIVCVQTEEDRKSGIKPIRDRSCAQSRSHGGHPASAGCRRCPNAAPEIRSRSIRQMIA